MAIKNTSKFDVIGFLTQQGFGRNLSKYRENQILYSQGDQANSAFYISKGKVKVTVISTRGKEAIVAIRGPDELWGRKPDREAVPLGICRRNDAMRDCAATE